MVGFVCMVLLLLLSLFSKEEKDYTSSVCVSRVPVKLRFLMPLLYTSKLLILITRMYAIKCIRAK